MVRPPKDPRVAMSGTWFQPRPITFVAGEERGCLQSESGEVKLTVKRQKKDGKVRRVVTLTDTKDGFTVTGCANLRYSRVHWDNGAMWARSLDFCAGASDSSSNAENNNAVPRVDDPVHQAAPCCGCGGPEDEEEDNAAPVCCSLFGGGRVRKKDSDAPSPEEPSQGRVGRVIPIEIISARGLRSADWGSVNNTYCKCAIVNKPGAITMRTPVVADNEPVWNHQGQLEDYVIGDDLVFILYDKDEVTAHDALGKVVLKSEQFHPDGFEGEIALEDTGGAEAYLTIDVAPESELHARKRMLSETQVANIVERVNETVDLALLTEDMEAVLLTRAVQTVNRRLRKALLTFCDRGWVSALQLLLDENKDSESKTRQVASSLKACFRDPLAEALTGVFLKDTGGFMSASILKVNKMIVNQLVEEVIERVMDGLHDIGLAITANDAPGPGS
mmetsp:Transcript_14042/g.40072  ORF Transcript_14042/g.40072 Transcript_14042/m.40072 type:complete len:446 (+) Transcript_14042:84-1421(+)